MDASFCSSNSFSNHNSSGRSVRAANHIMAGEKPVPEPQSLKLKVRRVGPMMFNMNSPVWRKPGLRLRPKSVPNTDSSIERSMTLKLVP